MAGHCIHRCSFTALLLEARQAGTREAIDVVMATAAVETGL